MKAPRAIDSEGSAGLGSPVTLILLILILGAVIYLWRMRYIRRKTFYVVFLIVILLIFADGISIYNSS
jgi:uncharacterized protein YqgC (DUF456 family)